MNTMKAIVKKNADSDELGFMEVPIPEINDNELLVHVKAIGVGIHDGYFLPKDIQYPYTIGIEAAGIIKKVGQHVTRFQEGQRITFVSSMQPKGGTWAEYAVVTEESLILPIPEEMTFEQAAAIPVAGNTALKALHDLQLKPNDTLFIAGASGAIGTFAIQLAVAKGWVVAGSASKSNHDYMRSLGAEKVVDYHDTDWTEQIRKWMPNGVDAVIAIQPGTGLESMNVLKENGQIVAVSGDQLPKRPNVVIHTFPYQVDVTEELSAVMNRIANNDFTLTIEKIYPFSEGLTALEKTNTRHARGKIVITGP